MAHDNFIVEKEGHIAVITFNRPPANPVSLATLEEMEQILDTLEGDREVRVVVITGSGEKAFCAGFDVKDAANGPAAGSKGSALWTRVDQFPKPVVAAINGFAYGGGCELALACTFRLMIESAEPIIGLTELNLGIIPGWGGTQRMMRTIGKAKTLDLILFSKRLNSQEALDMGMVDRVIPADRFMEDVFDFCRQLAERPPIAVGCVLKAVSAGVYQGMDAGLKVEREGSDRVRSTADCVEGFTAFLEKRDPKFKGE
jgi:enoyl-CoA hydratase/carnithine racemase